MPVRSAAGRQAPALRAQARAKPAAPPEPPAAHPARATPGLVKAGTTSGGGNGGALAGAGTGTGGGGGGGDTACTRELLKATVDGLFQGARRARTWNVTAGRQREAHRKRQSGQSGGDLGLWKTAGALKYVHSALDTDSCQSGQRSGGSRRHHRPTSGPRLKLVSQKITEIRDDRRALTATTALLPTRPA